MNAVIFAGPSLPPNLRPPDPALIWRPPVRQGELYQAALTRPAIIGVVDGYFEVTPTVWHKEILWAMAQGTHLHGPEEVGYPVVTEAMVNIRATLAAATDSCILGPSQAAHMTDIAKALFYKDRTYSATLQTAVRQGLKQGSLRDFTEWLRQGRIDLKLHDALEMVAIIQDRLALGVPALRVSYAMAHTSAWEAFRQPPKREFTGDLTIKPYNVRENRAAAVMRLALSPQ